MTRIVSLGCLLLLFAVATRADWREQNGAMWAGLTEQARLAYIQGFHSGTSLIEASCHVNVIKQQVKENVPQERANDLHAICDFPQHTSVSDEETIEAVSAFYRDANNERITISHVLDILAMRSRGESAETPVFMPPPSPRWSVPRAG